MWISALFKKFQARYGQKWGATIQGIEAEAVAEWSQGLAGLTGEQIKTGLDKWQEAWPPSLPEFRSACLGRSEVAGLTHNTAAYVEYRKDRLLEKKPDADKVKANLDFIRQALGCGNK